MKKLIKNKKEKKEEEKNITNKTGKKLTDMKKFLCEQDDITIECLLGLKNLILPGVTQW